MKRYRCEIIWGKWANHKEFAELLPLNNIHERKSNLQGLVDRVDLQLFQSGIDRPWKWLLGLGHLYRHDLPVKVIGWLFSNDFFLIFMFVMTVFLFSIAHPILINIYARMLWRINGMRPIWQCKENLKEKYFFASFFFAWLRCCYSLSLLIVSITARKHSTK